MADDLAGRPLKSIADIWKEILGVKKIEPDDNFFAIGGHSLLAVKLISAVQQKLGVELEMSAIYDFPTLREFSAHVSSLSAAESGS